MVEETPGIISHVSLGTRDINRAVEFYDAVMDTLGACRQEEIVLDDEGLVAVAYGKQYPEFWIQVPANQQSASAGNGVHIGFIATDKETVHRFHEVAIQHGGTDEGAPGPRPDYGKAYYGCFIIDADDNKIEATFWDLAIASTDN